MPIDIVVEFGTKSFEIGLTDLERFRRNRRHEFEYRARPILVQQPPNELTAKILPIFQVVEGAGRIEQRVESGGAPTLHRRTKWTRLGGCQPMSEQRM
jgi:hypothetical protein